MTPFDIPDNPYLLLTPGPLSTSPGVKASMLKDWCTWDEDYNQGVVQEIRRRLEHMASPCNDFTSVLLQGSGTFGVEAALGTMMPRHDGRLLICINGAYGKRMANIAHYLRLDYKELTFAETEALSPRKLDEVLENYKNITHVALVHNETTTGMLNPLEELALVVKKQERILMVDAMSSFGGIPLDLKKLDIDWLVSSANKCIQGVPGFSFILVRKTVIEASQGQARSLSLDLYDQWKTMEEGHGKWRYTSPTHVVRAFLQALNELETEGGIPARHERYRQNQKILVEGMRAMGFETLLPDALQSPFITSFYNPLSVRYTFEEFYKRLKDRGFVIYPGKVSNADCFRIGTIGHVFPEDIERLLTAIDENRYW